MGLGLVCSVALRAWPRAARTCAAGTGPAGVRRGRPEPGPAGRRADLRPGVVVSARPIRLHLEVYFEEGRVVSEHFDACLAGPAFFPRRHGRRRRGVSAQLPGRGRRATDGGSRPRPVRSRSPHGSRPSARPTGTCGSSTAGARRSGWAVPLRLHTDGVGRGLGRNPSGAARRTGKNWIAEGAENTSRLFIGRAVEQRPRSFDDNLTLAVIRSGGMP